MNAHFKKIAFVDICDTLYPCNTTIGFIKYILIEKGTPLSFIYNVKIIKIFNYFIYKIFNVDLIRKSLVLKLKNFDCYELDILAKEYVKNLNENKSILSLINKYRSEGFELQFHSASLEPIVFAISEKYKASKYTATLLSFEKGVCKGKIQYDNLGNKYKNISNEAKRTSSCVFITDNKSDSNCIDICDEFIAVVPRGKSEKFWKSKNVKIIKL